MRLRGEDGRPHPPVFSRQLRALARTLHAASLCSIFNHKFSVTAGRRIAVPIPNLRFRHSTVRRQGARRPPPREDPAQARHAPAGGFDNRTTGCSSSCLHEFRTAKLRRGSRTFAHDQVRRRWSKIITILQWVLMFEQSATADADRDGDSKLARLRRGFWGGPANQWTPLSSRRAGSGL